MLLLLIPSLLPPLFHPFSLPSFLSLCFPVRFGLLSHSPVLAVIFFSPFHSFPTSFVSRWLFPLLVVDFFFFFPLVSVTPYSISFWSFFRSPSFIQEYFSSIYSLSNSLVSFSRFLFLRRYHSLFPVAGTELPKYSLAPLTTIPPLTFGRWAASWRRSTLVDRCSPVQEAWTRSLRYVLS